MRVRCSLPSLLACAPSVDSLKPTQLKLSRPAGRSSPQTCDTKAFTRPSVLTTHPSASASLTSAAAGAAVRVEVATAQIASAIRSLLMIFMPPGVLLESTDGPQHATQHVLANQRLVPRGLGVADGGVEGAYALPVARPGQRLTDGAARIGP